MVLHTEWKVQCPAQSLEEHQNPGTFLLICCRLWGHIVSCQKFRIDTSSGLYHECQSRVWGEREDLHGLLCQKLQKYPKARESKFCYHRGKWEDRWVCREEQSLCLSSFGSSDGFFNMLATAVLNSKRTVPDVSDSLRMLVIIGRRTARVL